MTLNLNLENKTTLKPDSWYYVYQTVDGLDQKLSSKSPRDLGWPIGQNTDGIVIYQGAVRSDANGFLLLETGCRNQDHVLNLNVYDRVEISK